MKIKNTNLHLVQGRMANSYIYQKGKNLLVFDIGLGDENFVFKYINNNFGVECHVTLVAATHNDMDHSGGISSFAKMTGAKTAISVKADKSDPDKHSLSENFTRSYTGIKEMMRPRFWRMYRKNESPGKQVSVNIKKNISKKRHMNIIKSYGGSLLSFLKSDFDIYLEESQQLPGFPEWIAIETPGHSNDSVCFFNVKKKILISGDTLLGSSGINAPVPPSVYASKDKLLRSIEKIHDLAPVTLCPGHGVVLSEKNLKNKLVDIGKLMENRKTKIKKEAEST